MGTATASRVNTAAAKKAVGTSQTPKAFVNGVLAAIGAPVNKTTTGNLYTWLANEQTTTANWATNRGNPLGVQTSAAQAAGKSGNVLGGVLETSKLLLEGYPTIVASLRHSAPAPVFNNAVSSSSWNGATHYSGAATFAARGAAQKANPTGWFGQWVEPIFNHGGYIPIPGGGVVPTKTTPVQVVKTGTSAVKSVSSVGGLISKITDPKNLKNVGIFVGGMALTITGLVILFASTKEAKQLEAVGTKVAV